MIKSKFSLFTLILLLSITFLIGQDAKARAFKPSDIYKQYLARVYYARSLEDVIPYFIERTRMNMRSLTSEQAAAKLKKLKQSYIGKFTVKKEEVVGEMAFIEANGYAREWGQITPAKVRVEMYRESGAWKIKHHSWTGKVAPPKGQLGKRKTYR